MDSGVKKTRVLFCLPGRSFSSNFLKCWSNTLNTLLKSGLFEVLLSCEYSSFVTFARAKCLGADVLRGVDQKPFGGKLAYDVMVWIDSDVVWSADQVIKLLQYASVYPVVSGVYKMEDQVHYATVLEWDDAHYLQHGSYKFLTDEAVAALVGDSSTKKLMKCAYTGMGFMAVARGVFESIQYPWFACATQTFGAGVAEACSEDVAFCKNLASAGIDIMVDVTLKVGHEKKVVLQ